MIALAVILVLLGMTDIAVYLHMKQNVDELNRKVAELTKTVALHNLLVFHNKSANQVQSKSNTLLG